MRWIIPFSFCMLVASTAAADDHHLRLSASSNASGSTWEGDFASWVGGKVGARFIDLVGPYAQFQVGYGVVDDRMLSLLSLGGQVWLPNIAWARPFARLAFVHQHEESLSVVADDFGSALLGIGDGIRHRAGGELGLGVDIDIARVSESWQLYGAVDGSAKLFPDELGPMLYAGAGLNLGMSYTL